VPRPEIVAEDKTAAERVAIVGELVGDLVGVGVALGRVQASAVLDALAAGIKSGLGAGCLKSSSLRLSSSILFRISMASVDCFCASFSSSRKVAG